MEATEKLCSICKKNPVREGWRVCEECNDMTKGVAEIIEPKVVKQQCKICKKLTPVEELKTARHGWCFDCTTESMRQAKAKKSRTVENTDVHEGMNTNGRQLTIDFSRHPEIMDRIVALAMDELRTPECQVLYWLINNVR